MRTDGLARLRRGETLSRRELLFLTIQLSIPGILAQITTVVMQYIDASMVGHLGSGQSAAIGLVSSSTWLLGCLCSAVSVGFTVQIAHAVGAGDEVKARGLVRQGLVIALGMSLLILSLGVAVHGGLPRWLGGEEAIRRDASLYFLIYALFMPAVQINSISAGMLQCSGNMRLPSLLQAVMCLLDVVFNALLIIPTRQVTVLGISFTAPGAGLGVAGASLGTALSVAVIALCMLGYLLFGSPMLHLRREERLRFRPEELKRALKMAIPVAFEQIVMCLAYVASTRIVSPLGSIAIASHSFAITIESLCYMPGYGIGSAATTLVGQSVGAGRRQDARSLAWLTTLLGMAIMTVTGALMFLLAPWLFGLVSPDENIRSLGSAVLRIEAFAEPLYAASIVASGALRGVGDTLVPSCLNFISMWIIRLPLSALLATRFGLRGVWLAMCIELCARGTMFLVRLARKRWDLADGKEK